MSSKIAQGILAKSNAIIKEDHFVYASGNHGTVYVNKDAMYVSPSDIAALCGEIATYFCEEKGIDYDVVVGPEKGGIILAQWTAYNSCLGTWHKDRKPGETKEFLAAYAERELVPVLTATRPIEVELLVSGETSRPVLRLEPGEILYRDTGKFIFKRGYDKLIAGKRILIVEDVLTTGGTVKKVIEAVRACGGIVVGVGAICNRGGIAAEDLDVPELYSVLEIKLETWTEEECMESGPCSKGIPVNTKLGKGKDFLAKKGIV